ncbi:MAG TPA: hypothetical protein PK765_07350 [bacterium]|nr:hypothetical protein [bacterium]
MLSGVSPEENESQKASLRIANAGAAFLRSLVTPQNASALISDASKLAAVRSNPMFHDLVSLVDDRSGLTPEDRAALADRILE